MFRKKAPILTATYCNQLENLRIALEVLTGLPVRMLQYDFNSEHGKARINTDEVDVWIIPSDGDMIRFSYLGNWYVAHFENQEVRVINEFSPLRRGGHAMWWVGSSAANRRQEPLHPKDVQYCAQVRGLSVEDYLQAEEKEKHENVL